MLWIISGLELGDKKTLLDSIKKILPHKQATIVEMNNPLDNIKI